MNCKLGGGNLRSVFSGLRGEANIPGLDREEGYGPGIRDWRLERPGKKEQGTEDRVDRDEGFGIRERRMVWRMAFAARLKSCPDTRPPAARFVRSHPRHKDKCAPRVGHPCNLLIQEKTKAGPSTPVATATFAQDDNSVGSE